METLFNIIFRNDDTLWGDGKGARLTSLEVDMNFYECISRIVDLEQNPIQPMEIQSIEVDGDQMTITLSDGETEFGPFTLPKAAFRFTDAYAGGFEYEIMDLLTADEGLYLVLQAHEAPTEFDPDASNMLGPIYQLIFPYPTHYDMGFFLPGKPGFGYEVDAPVFRYMFTRNVFWPSAAAETASESESDSDSGGNKRGRVRLRVAAEETAGLSYPLEKNGVAIGSIEFAMGETDGEIVLDSEDATVQFVDGDTLDVINPMGTFDDTTARDFAANFTMKTGTA